MDAGGAGGMIRVSGGGAARGHRLAALQELIAARGAARLLRVSSMTIRRDLAAPDAPLACLGGHIVGLLPAEAARYTLDAERDLHAEAKRAACRRAAALVRPGDSLFIDCGTTMPHLVEALPAGMPLSVVCYSLNIAATLSRRPNTQLMLLGGLYHPSAESFLSEESLQYLQRLGIDKAFLSAGGVHPRRGVSCSNFNEVPVKQAAIAAAAESILVVDDTKLGQLKPAFFSPLAAFSRLIVGGSPPRQWRAQLKAVKLDIAA
jgi:DeoR family deoxyribose operon repressor